MGTQKPESAAPLVLCEDRGGGIRVLTLNRPERLNALTPELVEGLSEELHAAHADQDCRVVVLTGSGRGFCAGFDLQSDTAAALAERAGDPVRERLQGQAQWASLPQLIRSLRPVVIAAVNGAAAGGGLALALAADMRVASPTAKFVVANIKLGLSGGEMGIAYHLVHLVGPGRAGELMYTGRPLVADQALAWGVVNDVAEDALAAACALAEQIAAHPRFGVEMTKEVLTAAVDATSLDGVLALENRTRVLASFTPEMAAAVGRFGRPIHEGARNED